MNINRLLNAARRLWRALKEARDALQETDGTPAAGTDGRKAATGRGTRPAAQAGTAADGAAGEKPADSADYRRVFHDFADGLGLVMTRLAVPRAAMRVREVAP